MKIKFGVVVGTVLMLLVATLHSPCVGQDEEPGIDEKLREAINASESEDFEKALGLLEELVKQAPNNPDVQFFLGFNLHSMGRIDESIKYHKLAINSRHKPTALYNLACAYSLKNEQDKAFDYLKQAIDAGFRTMERMDNDTDLENIRSDDRFKEMVALIKNDGKAPKQMKAEDLYGEWKVISGTQSGDRIPSDHHPKVKITKQSFTIAADEEECVMSYKLDMDRKPIQVDFKVESGPVPEGHENAKGIIKLEDGKLTICYHPEGKSRPEKFVSTEENGFFMFKMEKATEKTEAKSEKGDMAKAVVGKWKCVKGTRSGEDIDQDRMSSVITFKDDTIKIPVGEDEAFIMSYTIDSKKSPVEIDMKIEEGPAPGGEALGILKMEGGKFYLCYDPMGQNRPDRFESTEDNQFFLFEMEHADK